MIKPPAIIIETNITIVSIVITKVDTNIIFFFLKIYWSYNPYERTIKPTITKEFLTLTLNVSKETNLSMAIIFDKLSVVVMF